MLKKKIICAYHMTTEFFLSFFRGYRRGGPFRAHFEKSMVACNLFGKPVKCI